MFRSRSGKGGMPKSAAVKLGGVSSCIGIAFVELAKPSLCGAVMSRRVRRLATGGVGGVSSIGVPNSRVMESGVFRDWIIADGEGEAIRSRRGFRIGVVRIGSGCEYMGDCCGYDDSDWCEFECLLCVDDEEVKFESLW